MAGGSMICGAIKTVLADIAGLSVFSDLRTHPLINALEDLLGSVVYDGVIDGGAADNAGPLTENWGLLGLCRRWAAFTGNFVRFAEQKSFYGAIAALTLEADNAFTRAAEKNGAGTAVMDAALDAVTDGGPPPALQAAAAADLNRLGRIAAFDTAGLGAWIAGILRSRGLEAAAEGVETEARAFPVQAASAAADLFPENAPWAEALPAFGGRLRRNGAGMLGLRRSFRWAEPAKAADGLWPVPNPDPVRLDQLSGYNDQRGLVVNNTLRFLAGKPANNLLLYGDRGTGKSATVKAAANAFAGQGLRLLEVRKADLPQLSLIMETLGNRALRFIIFIDDLSFEETGDSFISLKALLEGGIETKPPNTVLYATSNRRHLVKEYFADRPSPAGAASGDVRAFDTMQEQFSLADRFGLTVVFAAPDQEEYLRIAEYIAGQRGLLAADGTEEARRFFRENALRWERWFNGRSPRTAVQYVDWIAGLPLPWDGSGFPWDEIRRATGPGL
ncbi:MAG: ATP-binding protein [Treponema sp.]|jgi:predicted AAA+ superfamily ATPase|nr:ATP-binding protein [Treponema sp.]